MRMVVLLIIKDVYQSVLVSLGINQVNTLIFSALCVVNIDFSQNGIAAVEKVANYKSSDVTKHPIDMKTYRGGMES